MTINKQATDMLLEAGRRDANANANAAANGGDGNRNWMVGVLIVIISIPIRGIIGVTRFAAVLVRDAVIGGAPNLLMHPIMFVQQAFTVILFASLYGFGYYGYIPEEDAMTLMALCLAILAIYRFIYLAVFLFLMVLVIQQFLP